MKKTIHCGLVDDSSLFRKIVKNVVEQIDGCQVSLQAGNGQEAMTKLKEDPVDIVIMDLEMPIMGGLETIKKIREKDKETIIIVFSAFSISGATQTIEALMAGANDFLPKISGKVTSFEQNKESIIQGLKPKVESFIEKKRYMFSKSKNVNKPDSLQVLEQNKETLPKKVKTIPCPVFARGNKMVASRPNFIAIGCSTGGPDAVKKIFNQLSSSKTDPFIPMLIVQHMPPIFTKQFAKLLDGLSGRVVKEAEHGEEVKESHCYVAPGDYHMTIEKRTGRYFIALDQKEKVCQVRPAVDCLFDSLAGLFATDTVAIVLTGMGEDGKNGAIKLKEAGGPLYIQDRESSVVWGMPGSIDKAQIGAEHLDLSQIADLINGLDKRNKLRN